MNPQPRVSLCVLASGSSGNCSLLRISGDNGAEQLFLIDAGISPRRTRTMIAAMGLGDLPISGIILTHLDHDHWHNGWLNALAAGIPVWCHATHANRARSVSMHRLNLCTFEDCFSPVSELEVESVLASHDELGSAVFRLSLPGCGPFLGFATDLGRVQPDIVQFLAGVDTLAIESNYCPELQRTSDRPQFLKDRIMAGSGHLSNQQCLQAIARIKPLRRVVLLHLSRQCNTPERAVLGHERSLYSLVLTSSAIPTPWLDLKPAPRRADPMLPRSLFDGLIGSIAAQPPQTAELRP
ncbi:MAG: MBL fold metallo-hydrolase [bacterium]|nr:MBL fold metallo-hydrolase [bacterium]